MVIVKVSPEGIVDQVATIAPDTKPLPVLRPEEGTVVVIERAELSHVEYDEVEQPGPALEIVSAGGEVVEVAGDPVIVKVPRTVIDAPAISRETPEIGATYDPATDTFGPVVPIRQRIISRFEFLARLGLEAEVALEEAAATRAQVRVWFRRLESAAHVDLDHPELVRGLQLVADVLIAAGVWKDQATAAARIAEIRQ